MDTNQFAELLSGIGLLVKKQSNIDGPLGPNSVLITSMIVVMLTPLLIQIAGYFKSKAAAVDAAEAKLNALAAKHAAEKAADLGMQVHAAVNGDRVNTQLELKALREENLRLSKERATLAEKVVEHEKNDVRLAATKDAALAQAAATPPAHGK